MAVAHLTSLYFDSNDSTFACRIVGFVFYLFLYRAVHVCVHVFVCAYASAVVVHVRSCHTATTWDPRAIHSCPHCGMTRPKRAKDGHFAHAQFVCDECMIETACSTTADTADAALVLRKRDKMLAWASTVRDLQESHLRGGSRDTYETGKNLFSSFCLDMGHSSIQPDLLRWWVASRLGLVTAQTLQNQLAAIATTARTGGAPGAFMLVLEAEVLRLTKALDTYKTVPNKARRWQYAEVKSVADNTDWTDRYQSHKASRCFFCLPPCCECQKRHMFA